MYLLAVSLLSVTTLLPARLLVAWSFNVGTSTMGTDCASSALTIVEWILTTVMKLNPVSHRATITIILKQFLDVSAPRHIYTATNVQKCIPPALSAHVRSMKTEPSDIYEFSSLTLANHISFEE